MPTLREAIDNIKKQIMAALASSPKSKVQIVNLPALRTTAPLGIHAALEELVFEQMVTVENGNYILSSSKKKHHDFK